MPDFDDLPPDALDPRGDADWQARAAATNAVVSAKAPKGGR